MMLARCLKTALGIALCWAVTAFPLLAADTPKVEFDRDIRPILSNNCFLCHGPDSTTRKADLRLDRREDAVRAKAIVPGKADDSELVTRILSKDPQEVMPPPDSLKSLTLHQKDLLKRWVQEGAEYQPHWSFRPIPKTVAVPQPADPQHWVRSPLDAFVLARLQQAGLEPAAEATREKWLRRVTFDLTGLPPTLAEIDAFLADSTPQAYEAVVDRLLASPAYGERMANDWLDVSRFADTYGYQSDRDMHVWPWRDWVIRAFNQNLSYADFMVWQTAGDMLPNATRDQRLATAFNRLHRQTNEGGSTEEEYRVEYVSDRVHTNAEAWLGLTFECARCHDHKYDPITQRNYYQLGAFFNSIDEHGLYSHFTEATPTPALLLYEGDQEAKHRDLLEKISAQEALMAKVREAARERFDARKAAGEAKDAPAAKPAAEFRFEGLGPQGGNALVAGKTGQALQFNGDDEFSCAPAGGFGRTNPFSFSLWLKPGPFKPRQVILHRTRAPEDAAYRGYALTLDNGIPTFSLVHFWPGNAIQVKTKDVVPEGEWTHLTVTYDGSSHASGLNLYVNGKPATTEVVRDHLTRDIVYRQDWGDYDVASVHLALGARFRDSGFKVGAIDDLLVFDRDLTPLEVAAVAQAPAPTDQHAQFADYLARHDAEFQAALAALQALRTQENELVGQVRQIMTMEELPARRAAHILKRGSYLDRGEAVGPDTPESILAFPTELPRTRLGFARWLIHDQNPLPARVAVNRFWQMAFGRGLVPTTEDFGAQGQPPTHPELLNWLARHFIDSGWNVKAILKELVLSATYRQSSIPKNPQVHEEDPENRLLSHGPRYRLPAEQIRDNALAISGLMNAEIGGPSVRPYQPAGLWEESGTGKSYVQAKGPGLYRRSLYTFWRRTSPPPSMLSFDALSREVCSVRRERTATPLQSLVLLNDPQYVEAARVLAQKLLLATPGDTEPAIRERIQAAFRLLTTRTPTDRELKILHSLLAEQKTHFAAAPADAELLLATGEAPRDTKLNPADHAALTVLIQSLLSFDECVTKR